MNRDRSSSAKYITYVRHTSSAAANPALSLSASPDSLATIMKNGLLLTTIDVGEPTAPTSPDEVKPPQR